MRKIFYVLTTVFFLIIFVVFLPGILGFFSKDIDPIDDSDLQLKNIAIPESDNAYYDLAKLDDKIIYEPDGKEKDVADMAAGKKWDDKIAKGIISRNSVPLSYFAEAARKPKFQDPVFADPSKIKFGTAMPSIKNWRRVAQLSSIKALHLAKDRQGRAAMDEALNAARIGQKIQESQTSIIDYSLATIIKSMGLETAQRIIASSGLSNDDLSLYNQELDRFYSNEDGLIAVFKGSYTTVSHEIDLFTGGGSSVLASEPGKDATIAGIVFDGKNNYYFRPNKTKAIFAQDFRTDIEDVNKNCGEIEDDIYQKQSPSSPVVAYVTENVIGKILYDTMAIGSSSAIKKKCDDDLLVSSTQTMIAIKEFKNDNRAYPSSLGDLVPKYLPWVPLDPYNGKPLKYSASKKIIYSVGGDMKDSGGSTGDNWQTMTDPTFTINF